MPASLPTPELLRRLVGFDSTSRNSNLPLADFICDYLDRPGTRIERNPSTDGRKANLIISLGAEAGATRRGLVLSGHMDVVPADEDGWNSDPFVLSDTGETYAGRGTADMKGFLALAMSRAVATAETRLEAPLCLLFTYDEELGTLGAKRLVETWPMQHLPRRGVIGEPTSLRAVRMHKGHLKLRLGFTGQSAHSGYPYLGSNAIEPAGQAIVALSRLRETLEAERPAWSECFGKVPFVALNVAQIAGGVATNVIPDRCTLEVGLRPLPGMRSADLVDRVRETVRRALGAREFTLEVLGDSPPMLLDEAADLYRDLKAELKQAEMQAVSFTTDAGWLQTAGLDCVIFGPGSIEVAHQPNEFVPKVELERADRVLGWLIERYCLLPFPRSPGRHA